MAETGESEFGLWDDKLFGCGCYVRQRREGPGWLTDFDPCPAHALDEAFSFALSLSEDPHKARLILMAENRES